MKRNWDLIRELLHSIEIMDQAENDYGIDPKDKFVDDWGYFDKNLYAISSEHDFIQAREALRREHLEEVCEHIRMILDASLASCENFNRKDPTKSLASMRLTMQGYDLLAVMEYDGMWKQIKAELAGNSIPLTVFSIMELGRQITLRKIKVLG